MNQLFTLEELQMIADLLKDDNSDQAKRLRHKVNTMIKRAGFAGVLVETMPLCYHGN
jgi:hypothetical protein